MSVSTGAGSVAPGSGQGAAWVKEHGAHLMDYATHHLAPGEALPAVVAAIAACLAEPGPEGVSARGHLLAVLRADRPPATGHRERYVPESGPGMPDDQVIERAWSLVDPLGTETLRLMYRHGLTVEDLSHILAMPPEEAARLATRTQDLLETLVSGLDALANRRRGCSELAPLVETVFPDEEQNRPAAGRGGARVNLLSHMVKCPTCTRPINIRYTVPQMISHPRVAPLNAEVRRRLLEALPADPPPPPRPAAAPAAPAPVSPPGQSRSRPEGTRPVRPAGADPVRSPGENHVRPAREGRSTLPYHPVRPDRLPRPDRPRQRDRSTLPYGPALQDRPTHPALPALPADPPPPRRDPPLQETPFTHPRLRSGDATATVPSLPVIPPAGPPVRRRPTPSGPPAGRRSALPGPRTAPAGEAREWAGAGIRIMDALAWAGARAGNTATKILIILVAGVAGTLTGMNLLAPAIGAGTPESSLRSSAVRESASHDGSVPWNELAGRLRIPAVVTLDEFGRGSVILTVTEGSLTWRISAPGLTVTPSAGTSRAGRTEVIALRAHRIRHWCGTPSTATAPLTVHGPGGSITTTVRWRTC